MGKEKEEIINLYNGYLKKVMAINGVQNAAQNSVIASNLVLAHSLSDLISVVSQPRAAHGGPRLSPELEKKLIKESIKESKMGHSQG